MITEQNEENACPKNNKLHETTYESVREERFRRDTGYVILSHYFY